MTPPVATDEQQSSDQVTRSLSSGSISNERSKLFYNTNTVGRNGEIFCHGKLLETVSMAHIYNDSKTFVDMKLRKSPDETLKLFNDFMAQHLNGTPSKDEMQAWVESNFDPSGSEFENWIPDDFTKTPEFLNRINDKDLKDFASNLNAIWLELGRKMKNDVKENPELYSIIYVENPVIVPGGRFREFYYWDSYWIIRGLLLCEMHHTAKGMLENFLSIVERYGFIPNGGRIYYSMRSQPPLLIPMIKTYMDTTKDYDFAMASVEIMEREFDYFMLNHTFIYKGHLFARYGDKSSGPRPESFREDVETGQDFNETERENHYSELKAAAESGMDFSSRWFINADGTNEGDLRDLKTRYIIPVELNAILYWNAKIIAEIYNMTGNTERVDYYTQKATQFRAAVDWLWDDESGAWLDYDMINDKRRPYFTPTNLSPLWMRCYDPARRQHIADRVLQYINDTKLDDYPGGVPNSLQHTGEQWDWPNVWPPMQHILVVGLENLEDDRTNELAYRWAQRWVQTNYIAYRETESMYEKYLATEVGGHGGGGEYGVQKGFGWSNGVIMDLLNRYGSTLTSSNIKNKQAGSLNSI